MGSLLPTETNERQLPGQRVPQPSRDHHHEGAPGGQDRLSVLPGGAGGTVRFHRLLVVQVRHPGTGRSFADGGKQTPYSVLRLFLWAQQMLPVSV